VAAELVQRYPEVVEPLKDGRLCITSVVELAKVITPENRAEILPRFFHTSKKEAKEVSAEIRPLEAAPHRLVVTAARPAPAPREATAQPPVAGPPLPRVRPDEPRAAELPMVSQPAPAKVEPLTADLRRLHMTVSKRFMQKLEAARDALSHSHPGADAEAILEAGLDLLIERAAARKGCTSTRPKACARPEAEKAAAAGPSDEEGRGLSEQPRRQARSPRFIPAAVKREVWVRDGGRCQFRLASGELCGSTHRLQFDHVRPVALGGESTAGNLRLACSAHNLLAARRVFGDALMDRYAPARTSGAMAVPR